jgi:hypothetical protein
MAFADRFLLWRHGRGGTLLDRQATADDIAALRAFTAEHGGVEFYVEPATTATDTTVVAVDRDGAWIRRRVGSPAAASALARQLALPVYSASIVGYPARMREWNRTHRPTIRGTSRPGNRRIG